MEIYVFLLLFIPIIFSLLFLVSMEQIYIKILSAGFFVISTITAILMVLDGPQTVFIDGNTFKTVEMLILGVEALILVYLYWMAIKHKRWSVLILTIIQTGLSIYTSFFMGKSDGMAFFVDKLSLVMILIVNIIGTLILMFANEYMVHYEEHRHMKSRQKLFYFIICMFISAMNGIVISDSLSLVYFFWEITTIISFILISYNQDKEAYQSGFRALFLNMIGGVAFCIGIILFKDIMNIENLSQIIQDGNAALTSIIPVFMLCIAGFAKSAQLPFQSWLLGAMVAPTPVSALLHSSTMVKAGVYLIVKLAPAYHGTWIGTSIAIYGGFSFLICSALAVSQRNAKRVLAYSTIANLGLIISSAGIGTTLAVSAAIMLIIFHAISKALLFLCTGQIEHIVGSRDIEDMTGLIRKAPIVTALSAFGMLSMIVPPFGVLITKWISIEASANNVLVTIFLVLGSALTTVYYVKWLGTILAHPVNDLKPKYMLQASTYFPLGTLGIAILGASICITPIFNLFVSPEVHELLKAQNQLIGANGKVYSKIGSFNDVLVYLVLVAIVIVFLIVRKLILSPNIKKVYLCGENASTSNENLRFRNGLGEYDSTMVANLYLQNIISEANITKVACAASMLMIAAVLIGGII